MIHCLLQDLQYFIMNIKSRVRLNLNNRSKINTSLTSHFLTYLNGFQYGDRIRWYYKFVLERLSLGQRKMIFVSNSLLVYVLSTIHNVLSLYGD